MAKLRTEEKNACLLAMASALEEGRDFLKRSNELDMAAAATSGLSSAMLDRLKLDDKRIAAMAQGLREVAALPDPVGGCSMNARAQTGCSSKKSPRPSAWS